MDSVQWLEKQDGDVKSFEKVEHTFLNEDSGEMFCGQCGQSEKTRSNRSRSLLVFIRQGVDLERFTERHLHGKLI